MTANSGVVVITGGAGSGIGQGISRAIASAGWTTVVADRDHGAAKRLVARLRADGHDAFDAALDVADETSVDELFGSVLPGIGGLHGLVNSAGVGLVKPLAELSLAEWDRLHDIDLRGAFLCARAAIPQLAASGGGSIVNIGSVQALGPHVGYSGYAAAKAGLVGLTRGIAADYGRRNIRCSIIHPGFVDSPQNHDILAEWGDAEGWIERYIRTRQMIPRLITPEEIGATAVFLLSHSSRSITAAEITVDAGSSRMAFDNTEGRS
ncbi:SDR family NAD(P)-dependent oxidoreductase [Agromyces sp. NPDC058064]|uniref:SDR family NAD(P)-dependent oxidoreductase n=1 Tax=Agromyces sp. NPDC058064 TaxID=3346322 RepID=UPI0036D89A26